MLVSLAYLILFFNLLVTSLGQQYCATLDPSLSSEATGFISLNIDTSSGQGKYFVQLDLANVDMSTLNSQCDLTQGLSYHVHSYWENFASDVTSASGGSACGGANTGGHYDPNLACSGASQNLTACNRLSRYGSIYDCQFTTKPWTCEVGDLSGRFGKLQGDDNLMFTSSTFLTDNYPPYPQDYLVNDLPFWTSWASVVFHCSNGDRLLCAKFESTPSPSCIFPSSSGEDDDDGVYSKQKARDYFIAMIVCIIVAFLSLCAFFWAIQQKQSLLSTFHRSSEEARRQV